MKKRTPVVPADATENERAVALARRKYTGTNAKGETVCCLRKLLDPPKSPEAETLLWAAIGRKLAEKEPEFSRGSGRRPGSQYKKTPVDTSKNRRLRRYRANKARKNRIISIAGEDLELEPGVSLEPVWKR